MMKRSRRLLLAMLDMCHRGIMVAPDVCCFNCAKNAINSWIVDLVGRGEKLESILGCCFYTTEEGVQDEFYLSFGQIPHSKYGPVGLETKRVGEIVCECLKKNGLAYEWDGDPDKRILLKRSLDSRLPEPSLN